MENYIRKDLRDFSTYEPHNYSHHIKLDANESPFNLPTLVKEGLVEWLHKEENIKEYPDSNSTWLREVIANHYGLVKEQVMVGVGSDQLIDSIIRLFVEPGECVLMPSPSFTMYRLSTLLNHGRGIEYALDDNFQYQVETILTAYKKYKPKLIFLCTPNNPTGSLLKQDQLLYLLNQIKCPVVVDEAYGEFSNDSAIKYLQKYEHLVILKTFSKGYGLAGLRIGYALSSKKMIGYLNLAKPPYNVNRLSSLIAGMVLRNNHIYEEYIKQLIDERERVFNALERVEGITCYPSYGNFILIRSSRIELWDDLLRDGILVRKFNEEGALKGCLRITIGKEWQNDALIMSIKKNMEVKSCVSQK